MSHTLSGLLGLGKESSNANDKHDKENIPITTAIQDAEQTVPNFTQNADTETVELNIDDLIDLPDYVLADIPMPHNSAYNFPTPPMISNCTVVINYNFNH
jgi:hypothetical protein